MSLLERVTQAEATARQQADELRAQLAAVEEQLRRLAITRETLTEFADDYPSETDTAADDGVVIEEPSGSARSDLADEPPRLPPLRGFRRQVVAFLATAEEPMRAREIAQAIGKPDTRSQVEGMRSRLQRLVSDGWLRREADGLYAIASNINGHAPSWEAV
ncbi:hypothetical protein ABZ260_08310 [Streptosporangium sp. NPDC006013]|uniref:hypothetical protein n=1 Tax=Streptosporangium sp. NPDC006013 TaxID=3155596 RepID=UPI0033B5C55F